jgi:hypothetical protein
MAFSNAAAYFVVANPGQQLVTAIGPDDLEPRSSIALHQLGYAQHLLLFCIVPHSLSKGAHLFGSLQPILRIVDER